MTMYKFSDDIKTAGDLIERMDKAGWPMEPGYIFKFLFKNDMVKDSLVGDELCKKFIKCFPASFMARDCIIEPLREPPNEAIRDCEDCKYFIEGLNIARGVCIKDIKPDMPVIEILTKAIVISNLSEDNLKCESFVHKDKGTYSCLDCVNHDPDKFFLEHCPVFNGGAYYSQDAEIYCGHFELISSKDKLEKQTL